VRSFFTTGAAFPLDFGAGAGAMPGRKISFIVPRQSADGARFLSSTAAARPAGLMERPFHRAPARRHRD